MQTHTLTFSGMCKTKNKQTKIPPQASFNIYIMWFPNNPK